MRYVAEGSDELCPLGWWPCLHPSVSAVGVGWEATVQTSIVCYQKMLLPLKNAPTARRLSSDQRLHYTQLPVNVTTHHSHCPILSFNFTLIVWCTFSVRASLLVDVLEGLGGFWLLLLLLDFGAVS